MKPKTLKITAIVLASLAAFGVTAAAAYDSSEDPLVSLSYLTRIFKTELLEELNETIAGNVDFACNYIAEHFEGVEVYNLPKFPELMERSGPFHKYNMAATVRQLREKNITIPCFDTSCDLSTDPDAVCVLTACDKVLEKAVARKTFGRSSIAYLVKVVKFHPNTIHKFLGIFSCKCSVIQILLIIRIHILVKTSR